MLGILLAVLSTLGLVGFMRPIVRRFGPGLNETEVFGLAGLIGLTFLGWAIFFLIKPMYSHYLMYAVMAGLWFFRTTRVKNVQFAPWHAAIIVIFVFGLISALSEPSGMEWDTLAYHFAIPKLWISGMEGTTYIPFIHHSNFPFAIDSLFTGGLAAGHESMARAFTLLIPALGAITLSGLLKRRGHEAAVAWTLILLFGMPVMFSQLGTGYIDFSHGIYFGLGAIYGLLSLTEDEPRWVLAGLLIGGAMASKTTGMLAGVGLVAVTLLLGLRKASPKGSWRGLGIAAGLALVISGGWFVRNVVNTGNPVYPFFYGVFGGKGWDQWRADTYANEQKSFGVGVTDGKLNPAYAGHAILGLGYQPGRYINPNPQAGTGFPNGAVGAAWVVAFAASLANLRRSKIAVAGSIFLGVQLLAWLALSQQARYLGGTYVVGAFLAADLLARRDSVSMVLRSLVVVQALYTGYLQFTILTQSQLNALINPRYYSMNDLTPFANDAEKVNEYAGKQSVALYDEVFGYLLNVPYMWANPGHSMLIDQDSTTTPDAFVASLKKAGMRMVYVNVTYAEPEFRQRWIAALTGQGTLTPEDEKSLRADKGLAWKWLLAESVRLGKLRALPVELKRGILLEVIQE